jgi:hypothetical protein
MENAEQNRKSISTAEWKVSRDQFFMVLADNQTTTYPRKMNPLIIVVLFPDLTFP